MLCVLSISERDNDDLLGRVDFPRPVFLLVTDSDNFDYYVINAHTYSLQKES